MTQQRAVLADQVFANYEFGDSVTVEAVNGWEHTSAGNEWTRAIFVRTDDDVDCPSTVKLTFTVLFNDMGSIAEAYAIDSHGQIWGNLPADQSPAGNGFVDQPQVATSQGENTGDPGQVVGYRPVPLSVTDLDIKGIEDWSSKPACCPYCGSKNIREIDEWGSTSIVDDGNTCRQTEYHCDGPCEGRSFWCH